ncbi:Hypothetical predicted protein [Mytilus galloprovincialis]|uniref:Uncharacterized protein n=1 Tax=Mytilus galloprovincialis TaxID=29158 RepID=A0A8B6CS92_MYTGA|nr:Hypothetical predicted protein [Mytilus galloprovincialis]
MPVFLVQAHSCEIGHIKCGDGLQCVHKSALCDKEVTDCSDGSDEEEEMCKAHSCSDYFSKCSDGLQCVREIAICNGKKDCSDGSDEDVQMCKAHSCSDYFSKCSDGLQCVREIAICNGKKDCSDGSDEDVQMCKAHSCSDYFPSAVMVYSVSGRSPFAMERRIVLTVQTKPYRCVKIRDTLLYVTAIPMAWFIHAWIVLDIKRRRW